MSTTFNIHNPEEFSNTFGQPSAESNQTAELNQTSRVSSYYNPQAESRPNIITRVIQRILEAIKNLFSHSQTSTSALQSHIVSATLDESDYIVELVSAHQRMQALCLGAKPDEMQIEKDRNLLKGVKQYQILVKSENEEFNRAMRKLGLAFTAYDADRQVEENRP